MNENDEGKHFQSVKGFLEQEKWNTYNFKSKELKDFQKLIIQGKTSTRIQTVE